MRIISRFHDYYDGCMSFGMDPKCVYKREEKKFEEVKDFPVAIKLPGIWNDHLEERGVVWFCGKVYPYIVFDREFKAEEFIDGRFQLCNKQQLIFCYTLDQFKTCFNFIKRIKDKRKKDEIKEVANFFNSFLNLSSPIVDILCKLGVPVLRYSKPRNYRSESMILNPRLSDCQFYRIVDSFTAYQELSMFISGVMGGKSPPIPVISDVIRLEKHGFDKKTSFRKTK